jgi:hypothetical protein
LHRNKVIMKLMAAFLATSSIALLPGILAATDKQVSYPKPGIVDRKTGLTAWSRIYEVTSHPRCANCHVSASDEPMWSGPSYGRTRPHGMKIRGGKSRIGAEFLPCSTCHAMSKYPQNTPHSAPRVRGAWRLAPKGAAWFGQSSEVICAQLRDPKRNGGMDYKALAKHLDHDVVLPWAWSPGPGREPAPYSLEAHVMDMLLWGAADQPCPQD